MAHMDGPTISILQALFGMGVLTFVMGGWMTVTRLSAMGRAKIDLEQAAHVKDLAALLPSSARRVADNYNHLFETPVLFYATALAIVVLGLADPVYAACAWAYLILRALHSVTQATFNRVLVRAWLYGLSWAPLAVMIFRPLFSFH